MLNGESMLLWHVCNLVAKLLMSLSPMGGGGVSP